MRPRTAIHALIVALLGACGADVETVDATTAASNDGGGVITDCTLAQGDEGAACDFDDPCISYYDDYFGKCGTEEWHCVDEVVVLVDNTGPC